MRIKKLLPMILAIFMALFVFTTTVTANQANYAPPFQSSNVNSEYIDNEVSAESRLYWGSSLLRSPNGILVKVGKVDADRVKITVSVSGEFFDSVDSVSFNVKITDTFGKVQYNKDHEYTNILPIWNQGDTIYVKSWSRVELTNIEAKDGSDEGTLDDVVLDAN